MHAYRAPLTTPRGKAGKGVSAPKSAVSGSYWRGAGMRVLLARLMALIAVIEGSFAIPVKWSGDSFLGVWGGGWLKAAGVSLIFAIYLVLDDLRDRYQRAHQ